MAVGYLPPDPTQDFVNECNLVTKEVNFALMTLTFTKANATNTAAVRKQRAKG